MVDASRHEDEMGETAPANPVLEVSVSFGRFANDSLSWEKWSSFSPNKYLEEVERCATPGSVAQKAAYFEAHYKKIAARKAELLDQKKQMDNEFSRSNGDLIEEKSNTKSESDLYECQTSVEVVDLETILANEVCRTHANEPDSDAAITLEFPRSSIGGVNEDAERQLECLMSDKSEEAVHVMAKEVKNTSMGVQAVNDLQQNEMENTSNDKEVNVKLDRSKESHMITLVNEERNITRTKKKPALSVSRASSLIKASPTAKASHIAKISPTAKALPVSKASSITKASPITKVSPITKASPVTKASSITKASPITKALPKAKMSPVTKALSITKASPIIKALPIAKMSPVSKASSVSKTSPRVKAPQISAARLSKPTLASTPTSSQSSARIGNSSSSSNSKNPSGGENKKLAPKSLHMSLSVGPSNHDPASVTVTRKSLIMESMGDKDIVKRAFKTFQNRYNQLKSVGEDHSLALKQLPAKETETRVSAFMTPRKENQRSFKAGDLEKKHGNTAPSSLPMKSGGSAEKRGEFSRKLEEKKSYSGEADGTHLQTKSKEGSNNEIHG